jgi:hypothetical protein
MNPDFAEKCRLTWPGLNSQEMSAALWSLTTFPMGNEDEVLAALKDAYEKSGGDLLQAFNQADEAISAELLKRSEQSQPANS